MEISQKKQGFVVVIIVILTVGLVTWLSCRNHLDVAIAYPDKSIILSPRDFQVITPVGILQVGESSWDEVNHVFPMGKTLGMSTVYKPLNQNLLLTFANPKNILEKADLLSPILSTNRGVKISDSIDVVIQKYGDQYIKITDQNDPQHLDMVYGTKPCIVFNITDEKVSRIVLDHTN